MSTVREQQLATTKPKTLGRPRVITKEVVRELSYWLGRNADVKTACIFSGISTSTYYKELSENKRFSDKMTIVQQQTDLLAKATVASAIEQGDLKTARWWIDRQDRLEHKTLRAKEYRLIKRLTVTENYSEKRSIELEIDVPSN